MSERLFPLLSSSRQERFKPLPWRVVEQWREQIEKNHDQTMERLAERGGLCHSELYWAAHGIRWREMPERKVRDAWMREQEGQEK